MKRLTFKPEHVEGILAGSKTWTNRWKWQGLVIGDVVAAVTAKDGKPAFLTKADDRFATLRITEVRPASLPPPDGADCLTGDMAKRAGFATLDEAIEWYEARRPAGAYWLWGYGFEVMPK